MELLTFNLESAFSLARHDVIWLKEVCEMGSDARVMNITGSKPRRRAVFVVRALWFVMKSIQVPSPLSGYFHVPWGTPDNAIPK